MQNKIPNFTKTSLNNPLFYVILGINFNLTYCPILVNKALKKRFV
ncbi:hypothetical protein DFQ09_10939 [Winogradskyella pacifica]|uniref:Uncharacterized protein n=1 Tax=Winogradskyella pacifica TaxID=664642 RepID=A0A3D9LKU0_9FLAO|nr:hypothetical protein DFQ09_10939 [Winogradskyella pacifica]